MDERRFKELMLGAAEAKFEEYDSRLVEAIKDRGIENDNTFALWAKTCEVYLAEVLYWREQLKE